MTLACGAANATLIYSGSMTLTANDPTQLGRLSRNGIPQDWSGGEVFPGYSNTTTAYYYHVLDLDLGTLESGYSGFGRYLQIEFDSTATTTFLAAYLNVYTAPGQSTQWLGDAGSSGNFFGTDPQFFQVIAPTASDHLLLVLNGTGTGASNGLGLTGNVKVEAFTDTEYTDLTPNAVPEPGAWTLLMCAMGWLPTMRRKLS